MPSMANITVKKADGTTDVTYTALAGSSGEGIPALWRDESYAGPAAFRPTLKVSAKGSTTGGTRTVEALHVRPITLTEGGVTKQVGTHTVRVISKIETTDAQSNINEAVNQGVNLAKSTLVVDSFEEGFAPRG